MEQKNRYTHDEIEAMLKDDSWRFKHDDDQENHTPTIPSRALLLAGIVSLALWGLFFWWLRS